VILCHLEHLYVAVIVFLNAVQRSHMREIPMNELASVERRRLLDAAQKIHAHKLMRAKGLGALARKAKEERIKQLLLRISADETSFAEFWLERIEELRGERPRASQTLVADWKVGFVMRILGVKGFLEWTVVGEEEGIRDLAIQAEHVRDTTTSEAWSRTASDERLHLERMKTEVLGMEAWEIRGGGGVRDMIFGANDGLVSHTNHPSPSWRCWTGKATGRNSRKGRPLKKRRRS
jgi:hypothetical protein